MAKSQKPAAEKAGNPKIESARGKLGVMIPGMGAVATTFVAGVEAVRRRAAGASWLFLVNHTDREQPVDVAGEDLVSQRRVGPQTSLAPGGVAVIRED